MAGKKLDRVHVQSALETIRENPGIALFMAAPVVIVLGVVWWLAGFGTALLVLILAGVIGVVVQKVRS